MFCVLCFVNIHVQCKGLERAGRGWAGMLCLGRVRARVVIGLDWVEREEGSKPLLSFLPSFLF